MKQKWYIVIIAILVVSNVVFFVQKQDLYYQNLYEDAVPHIELGGVFLFYGVDIYQGRVLTSERDGAVGFGEVTGFVTFLEQDNQPKQAWQYYTIEATDVYDNDGNQLFSLEEVIKLPAVAPKVFEKEELRVVEDSSSFLVLESEGGQIFKINKATDEVRINEGGEDVAYLITDSNNYRDFMVDFLSR